MNKSINSIFSSNTEIKIAKKFLLSAFIAWKYGRSLMFSIFVSGVFIASVLFVFGLIILILLLEESIRSKFMNLNGLKVFDFFSFRFFMKFLFVECISVFPFTLFFFLMNIF